MTPWNPTSTPNFSIEEMTCSCGCGQCEVTQELMSKLQEMRNRLGVPLKINSGYRCRNHPNERGKEFAGAHTQGKAADIYVGTSLDRFKVMREAFALGFVGVACEGNFVHVDVGHDHAPRPSSWVY